MRLYFLRHAQSVANTLSEMPNGEEDWPLTEAGREQAAALAQRMLSDSTAASEGCCPSDLHVTHLYSSPLERARDTAEVLGAALGVMPTFDERLVEAHGEEGALAIPRVREFEAIIRSRHANTEDRVLLVGHQGFYNLMMRSVMASSLGHTLQHQSTDLMPLWFRLDNLGMTEIRFFPKSVVIARQNVSLIG